MAANAQTFPQADKIKQSPPIDLSKPYDPNWIDGKCMLITGGASGFGAAFVRKWASHGATVIVGDIDVEKGDQLAREVNKETGKTRVHFVHCDVTDWQSQVAFFKEAVKLSPHGGIDTVVANAGVIARDPLQFPRDLSVAEPREPRFTVTEVNYIGVLYTIHLAFYWLPRNPGSSAASPDSDPNTTKRDRHIILLGSVASLISLPAQPQYAASKHAVLGLFRAFRATSFADGIRINLLCPYFIDTGIVPAIGRVLLAGGGMGKVEDVVDAATRVAADTRICGRSLSVGPKVKVKQLQDGEWVLAEDGEPQAVWEAFGEDWEDSELFQRNMIRLLNAFVQTRGWVGWLKDMISAVVYGLKIGWR